MPSGAKFDVSRGDLASLPEAFDVVGMAFHYIGA